MLFSALQQIKFSCCGQCNLKYWYNDNNNNDDHLVAIEKGDTKYGNGGNVRYHAM